MTDARARLVEDRRVLANAVVGLHLEAPPVRPDGRAGVGLRQQVRNLVGLYGVVERADLVAELLCRYRA